MTDFPPDFVWGAATSSYQIEGAVNEDGRGRSIWDTLCDRPGAIADGSSGAVAVDHRHRFRDDVGLMRTLGLSAYRFSIAWPRVQPGGRGPLNPAGVGFYDQLVDSLLEAGITPFATLYHWDLPQELEDAGGWPDRSIVDRFVDYATAVHEALGDRIGYWATLNEPWCTAWLGYGAGIHAPGVRDFAAATRAAHHLMLAHGRAVSAMRDQRPDNQLGVVLNFLPAHAADPDDLGLRDAVRRIDGVQNRMMLGAVLGHGYPTDVLEDLAQELDGVIHDGDLAEAAAPLDFLGVNYYNDGTFERGPSHEPGSGDARGGAHAVSAYPHTDGIVMSDPGPNATDMRWPQTPEGLGELLRWVGGQPGCPPLYITENGCAFDDPVVDGRVDDPRRVAFLAQHLRAAAGALADGVDLRGYFVWSLLDNFEWAEGYRPRFGMVHVDYDTQVRTPKRSAHLYRDLIASGGDLSVFDR